MASQQETATPRVVQPDTNSTFWSTADVLEAHKAQQLFLKDFDAYKVNSTLADHWPKFFFFFIGYYIG